MKESDVRLHLHHALQWRGWSPFHHTDGRKCPHCYRTILPTVAGRADTIAKHYTVTAPDSYIEVKDCKDTAFAFSEISEDQRKFLSAKGSSYICIGRIVPMGTKTTIHSIYVIPWDLWKKMEEEITLLLQDRSVPYDYQLYTNRVAARGPDLVTRFSKYALEKRDGNWHFKDDHPLAVQGEIETPHFMREKDTKWANAEKAPALP